MLAHAYDPTGLIEAHRLQSLAATHVEHGNLVEAQRYLTRSVEIRERALGREHRHVAPALANLARSFSLMEDYEQALPRYERALVIEQRFGGDDSLRTFGILLGIGEMLVNQGQYADASEVCKKAQALTERHLGGNHPNIALTLTMQGHIRRLEHRIPEARALLQRGLALREASLGLEHPRSADSQLALGQLEAGVGNYQSAIELYEQVVVSRTQTFGAEHPKTVSVVGLLGEVHFRRKNYEKAIELLARTLELQKRDGRETIAPLSRLASAYAENHQLRQAKPLFERALVLLEQSDPPNPIETAGATFNLANLNSMMGELETAKQLAQRAISLYEATLGMTHPNLSYAQTGLGEVLAKLGDHAGAIEQHELALAIRLSHKNLPPRLIAETQLFLAKSLWAVSSSRGQDRVRAHRLARAARATYESRGKTTKPQFEDAEAWLDEHLLPERPHR